MAARKDHPESSPAGKQAKTDAEQADAATAAEVQANVDRETEQGFRGVEVDPTPNEAYTLKGVTSGLPTPETDPAAAEQARQGQVAAQAAVDGATGRAGATK